MTYVITGACIGVKDESCVATCPVDCIVGAPGDPMLFIDPALCIDCAACVPACPVKAIVHEKDAGGELAQYTALNRDYFADPKATVDRVHLLHRVPSKEAAG